MRKLIFAVGLLLATIGAALAQGTPKTKSLLNTEVTTNFPDNTTGAITPSILRTTTNDIIASMQQYAAVNAQTGVSYTIAVSDYGQLVTFNNAGAVAVTLPQATGTFSTFNFFVTNLGAGLVTITPTTSTINGAASLAVPQNSSVWIVSDGTNYQIARGPSTLALISIATNAALKALPGGVYGTILRTGYYSNGDAPHALYVWNGASACTDDGGSCIAPNAGTGRWVLVPMGDYIDAKIFGVIADSGTTDNTALINNAWSYGASIGQDVVLPGAANSAWIYAASTINAPTASTQNNNWQRSILKGQGIGSTILRTGVTGTTCGISISENQKRNYFIRDMTIESSSQNPATAGRGLCMQSIGGLQAGVSLGEIANVDFRFMNYGIFGTDIENLTFYRVKFDQCVHAMAAQSSGAGGTGPDKLTFIDPQVYSIQQDAFVFTNASTTLVLGGDFEGNNGAQLSAFVTWHFLGGPSDGSHGATFVGGYYAASSGTAYVWLDTEAAGTNVCAGSTFCSGQFSFHGVQFDQQSSTQFVTNPILISNGAATTHTTVVDIRGSSFGSFNSYVASASRTPWKIATPATANYRVTGYASNFYWSLTEAPWMCPAAAGWTSGCENDDDGHIRQWGTGTASGAGVVFNYAIACPNAVDNYQASAINGATPIFVSFNTPGLSSNTIFSFNSAGAGVAGAVSWQVVCH